MHMSSRRTPQPAWMKAWLRIGLDGEASIFQGVGPETMNLHHPRCRGSRFTTARRRARTNSRLACEILEERLVLSFVGPSITDGLPAQTGPVAQDLLHPAASVGSTDSLPSSDISEGLGSEFMQYDASGRVAVSISATDPQGLVPSLQAMGVNVPAVVQADDILDAYVPIAQLPALADLTGQGLLAVRADGMITSTGSVDAQSDQMTEADRVRSTNLLSGSGVTVGVLSDSYNNLGGAAADIASGDLSTPVFVRDNVPANTGVTGEDEGRAMMQIVHDIAPSSPLAFATAEGGQATFAQNIQDLAKPT